MRSGSMRLVCGIVVFALSALAGCSWWESMTVRSQSPDDLEKTHPSVRTVGDLAVPFGLHPLQVESVGLVTGLRGTGSDPQPSIERQMLLSEMQTRNVQSPNTVLASPNTALVLVRGVLRPGIQKGDRFDLEVRVPNRSETTSLRSGWLMQSDLKEMALLSDNRLHSGHTWGRGEGAIMVDPSADDRADPVLRTRGRVLGGGVALKSRPLGLVLKPEAQSVLNSALIESAVNKRFHVFYKGTKKGVAKAQTDQRIELQVHPRYAKNIDRYVQVVRAIALRESEAGRQERLRMLERQLADSITSYRSALQLEAMGHQGVEVLLKGIESSDPEVRFYSAEALAYLDRSEAAEPLARAAREQPAFRVFALAALSLLNDLASEEELVALLNGDSAETRYGAFRALCEMNRNNPAVMGEQLGDQFSYHVLNTQGPAMIHVTRGRRPEVVLFGPNQRFNTPFVLEAGNRIMVKSEAPGRVAVSRFVVGELDQRRLVSDQVDDVIRAIVELGGTYPDVVQALQEAHQKGVLSSRFAIDALPEAGRTYDRVASASSENAGSRNSKSEDSPKRMHPLKAFFAKMGRGESD